MGEGVAGCVHATGKASPDRRHVVAIQRRVARDLPRPWFWSVWTWASAHFMLVGETATCGRRDTGAPDEQGMLTGVLVLLQKHSGQRQQRRDKLVSRLRALVGNYKADDDIAGLGQHMRDLAARARAPEPGSAHSDLTLPAAQFVLYRSGEFRLNFIAETLPTEFKTEDGVPVAEADRARYVADFRDALAHHFYYFVRDLAHRHYHHHRRSDSLLPIHPTSPAEDFIWRRETTYALGRAALEARREEDLLSYKKAEGLVAYARAFERSLGGVVRSDPGNYEAFVPNTRPLTYDWESLLSSITSSSDEELWRYSGRVQAFAAVLAAGIGTVALWFAIAQIPDKLGFAAPDPNSKGLLLEAARLLYNRPAAFTFWVLITTWVGYELFGRGFRAFEPLQAVIDHAKRAGYALAASISVRLRRILPSASDLVGAYAAGTVSAMVGATLFNLALALSAKDPANSVLGRLVTFLWREISRIAGTLGS